MNPMTNTKNIKKLSEQELRTNFKTSWHDQYKDSAWIFVGGLPYDLTEGDIICVFSQYGDIVNINLVRDKATGKQKGFCFICFEDQRSTVLSVDNFNGIKILGRTIRVDHVANYKVPKDHKDLDPETRKIHNEGCAHIAVQERKQLPIPRTSPPPFTKEEEMPPDGFRLPPRLPIGQIKEEVSPEDRVKIKKEKKHKKEKKNKKKSKKKHKKKVSSSESNDSSDSSTTDDSVSEDDRKKNLKKRKYDDRREKDEGKRQKR